MKQILTYPDAAVVYLLFNISSTCCGINGCIVWMENWNWKLALNSIKILLLQDLYTLKKKIPSWSSVNFVMISPLPFYTKRGIKI